LTGSEGNNKTAFPDGDCIQIFPRIHGSGLQSAAVAARSPDKHVCGVAANIALPLCCGMSDAVCGLADVV